MKDEKYIPEIMCCCDDGFIVPLVTMLTSLSKNLEIPLVKVNIVTYKLSVVQIKQIKQILNYTNLELKFYNGNCIVPDIFPECEQYPKSIYLKLYGLNLVSCDIDKILYLDTDLIVLSSIHRLFQIDLNENLLLAVPEMGATLQYASSKNGIYNYKDLNIPGKHKMLNSGVLLINLKKWRKENILGKMEAYSEIHRNHIRLFDQELFNVFLWNDWQELNPQWNVSTDYYNRKGWLLNELNQQEYEMIRKNAKIIHYTKVPKPWIDRCAHPDKRIWEMYFQCALANAPLGFKPYYKDTSPICPGESGEIF